MPKENIDRDLETTLIKDDHYIGREILYHIPCLYLSSDTNQNKFLIFFHGNGEDIFYCRDLCQHICNKLDVGLLFAGS
jgi:hypothetical protein